MTQYTQRILEKVFNMKRKWREKFGDSRMLIVIDFMSWKVYGYGYI